MSNQKPNTDRPTDRLEALIRALAHPYTGADQVAMETEALAEVNQIHDTLRFITEMATRDRTGRETDTAAGRDVLAELRALAVEMRAGLHDNRTDRPVSVNLDDWVERLDRMITASASA